MRGRTSAGQARPFLVDRCNGTADGDQTPIPPGVVLSIQVRGRNSHICAGKTEIIYGFIGGMLKN
jgi:hypothetical protein